MMWTELRKGHESLMSAFAVWKEATFLRKQEIEKRIYSQRIKKESKDI